MGGNGATLRYDPLKRLWQSDTTSTSAVRYGWDSLAGVGSILGEYDGAGALQRRYAYGPGVDDAIAWYEGTGTDDRRFLIKDERGSVIAVTDGNGNVLHPCRHPREAKRASFAVPRCNFIAVHRGRC